MREREREFVCLWEREKSCAVSKKTYYSVKRDLIQCQKRPTTVSKETYYSVYVGEREVLRKK